MPHKNWTDDGCLDGRMAVWLYGWMAVWLHGWIYPIARVGTLHPPSGNQQLSPIHSLAGPSKQKVQKRKSRTPQPPDNEHLLKLADLLEFKIPLLVTRESRNLINAEKRL